MMMRVHGHLPLSPVPSMLLSLSLHAKTATPGKKSQQWATATLAPLSLSPLPLVRTTMRSQLTPPTRTAPLAPFVYVLGRLGGCATKRASLLTPAQEPCQGRRAFF